MTHLQQILLLFFALYAGSGFALAWFQCRVKKNAFGLTPQYYLIGAYVWGDVLVFGPFWLLVSAAVWYLQDALLFWLMVSVFSAVRSLGESIYWFNQQFSTIERNPPARLPGYWFVRNDSIWFIYQIVAQCILVVSIIASVYFGTLWVREII